MTNEQILSKAHILGIDTKEKAERYIKMYGNRTNPMCKRRCELAKKVLEIIG